MILPRIRKDLSRSHDVDWLVAAILVGYPKPGIGLCVDLYRHLYTDRQWTVALYSNPEAGR